MHNMCNKGSGHVELNWLFNVTINDISVIHVTAHRSAGGLKKKLNLRSGSQRQRHFVEFFNGPVQAPTRDQPFYMVIPTHRPNLVAFYDTLGIRKTHSRFNPRVLTGGHVRCYGDALRMKYGPKLSLTIWENVTVSQAGKTSTRS